MNITVRQCMIGETEWFRRLEGKYHYMDESHGAGDLVRLVFEEDGRPVALMTWAAAREAAPAPRGGREVRGRGRGARVRRGRRERGRGGGRARVEEGGAFER